MFTWRDLAKNKSISSDYFKNILNLLQNNLLSKEANKNNVTLYFAFHHRQNEYKLKRIINKYIKFINFLKGKKYNSK